MHHQDAFAQHQGARPSGRTLRQREGSESARHGWQRRDRCRVAADLEGQRRVPLGEALDDPSFRAPIYAPLLQTERRNRGGARRDLEELCAAIGHHAAGGYHREIVKISLPQKGEPRDKWLTRSDAAKLIWICWQYREMQRSRVSRRTTPRPRLPSVRSDILLALFYQVSTAGRAGGHRSGITYPSGRSLLCRLGARTLLPTERGSAKTNKRQPSVPIPSRLLAHLRRWHRIDPEAKHFVEFNGKPVNSVKTAFKSVVKLAGLGPGISPHTLVRRCGSDLNKV
jgi:integrase